jgi:hypothetical protein
LVAFLYQILRYNRTEFQIGAKGNCGTRWLRYAHIFAHRRSMQAADLSSSRLSFTDRGTALLRIYFGIRVLHPATWLGSACNGKRVTIACDG